MALVKISELPALDALATNDLIPVRDTSSSLTKYTTGQQILDLAQSSMVNADNVFRVVGSADATKKLAFEVDGVTAATTRTITIPDRSITLGLILATPQTSTSGTSIDFTSIPSGVRRITIMLNEVSTNGTSVLRVQLGDAGGVEVTGYAGAVDSTAPANNVWATASGIDLNTASVAVGVYSGVLTLTLLNSTTNVWVVSGILARTDSSVVFRTTGRKATSAVLDRVRVTTVNGTDTFDAGEINIAYEY